MIGRSLGHYEILEPLGADGMVEVCRVRETNGRFEIVVGDLAGGE